MQKGFSRIHVSAVSRTQKKTLLRKARPIVLRRLMEDEAGFSQAFEYPENVFVLIDRIVVKRLTRMTSTG
jgi:excinuclease ABC subunit A